MTQAIAITQQTQALQAVASKDSTRFNITGVYLNSHYAIATDGNCLAVAKKQESELASNKIIAFKSPKQKGKLMLESYLPMPNDTLIGTRDAGNQATVIDGQFPDIKKVLKHHIKPETLQITIDVDLLAKLANALCGDSKHKHLTLSFSENESAVFVASTRKDAFGMVMPISARFANNPRPIAEEYLSK